MKQNRKSNETKWGILCVAGALTLVNPVNAAEELTQLEDMVVTGTRTEKKLSEVPVRTELIKRDEIEVTAARTLADACEFTPGVRVESKCMNCNFTEIRLLGMDGPYSQVLIDGQPIMSAMAAVYGLEHIPARQIDRLEVIKGGGSALYGSGSVAGVINVISRNPTESGADIDATVESIDGTSSTSFSGAGDVVSEDGKSRMTIYGQVDSRDGYDRNGDGFTEIAERDMTSVGANLRQFVGDNADFTLGYTHVDESRRGGDNLDKPEFQAEVAEAIDSTRDAVSGTWSHGVNDKFDYRLTAAFSYTDRDTYYGAGMDPNAYGSSQNPLALIDSQFNHYLGKHTVTWGGQYSWENLTDSQPGYNLSTDVDYDNFGLYLQDDWQIVEPVSLVIGGRVDKHSELDDPVFSPRVAAMWAPAEDLNIRASYAHGFRAPQIFSEDLHIAIVGGDPSRIENADDLEEETSDSFTLGAEWTPAIGSGFGLFEVTGFYTMLDGKFAEEFIGNDGTFDIYERYNASDASIYGVEFNLGYQKADKYEVRLGWVFQQSEYDESEGDFGSSNFEYTPDSYGVLSGTYNAPWDLLLFVGGKFTGPMEVPHYAGWIADDTLEDTDAFMSWDASVAKTFGFNGRDLTLTLGVKNIFDEFQDDLDEGADRDPGYIYGPRAPRTVYASAKYAF